ncbi:MAG TPA: HD domain-containing protein [Candidatus Kapabacteria bacterium]|nr:HD domain-containing protein [Candidatus Kapabacteria bacterium]HPP40209.1 HD domain-containing protein [Candidatus Kapabacteria bacterium]
MIANFELINELFRGFHIQRWNDRVRPMNFSEIDKHSHKFIIAYVLGKYEEKAGKFVDWDKLIQNSIFEFLRRIVISDIKSPIYREIKKNKAVFQKLNEYIFEHLKDKIKNEKINDELEKYLFREEENDLTNKIINAAHIYSSFWEFQIVRTSNPNNFQNLSIETELLQEIKKYTEPPNELIGIKKLIERNSIANFIDLCGQLRFQIRWAQTPRVPQTSVLGHTLMVATLVYFFTADLDFCKRRMYNNFFCGLFHDLPEAVTRDIISPVKRSSPEFDKLISDLEKTLAEQEIFPHVEPDWIDELKYFTQNEFENKIKVNNTIETGLTNFEISEKYNKDEFCPLDGNIVRWADQLAAYLEAWHSINNGIKSQELVSSAISISNKYLNSDINFIDIKTLYNEYQKKLG